jgi:hypothetical protein
MRYSAGVLTLEEQAIQRGNAGRARAAGIAAAQPPPPPEPQPEPEEPEPEYSDDESQADSERDPKNWRAIPVAERQEAILHMLASYDADNAESEWSETASEATLPPGAQARNFFSGVNQYARKTAMGDVDKQVLKL